MALAGDHMEKGVGGGGGGLYLAGPLWEGRQMGRGMGLQQPGAASLSPPSAAVSPSAAPRCVSAAPSTARPGPGNDKPRNQPAPVENCSKDEPCYGHVPVTSLYVNTCGAEVAEAKFGRKGFWSMKHHMCTLLVRSCFLAG